MSYILDALRRADAERERGAVPGLHSHTVPLGDEPDAAPRRVPWLSITIGAVVGIVGLLLWRSLATDPEPQPAPMPSRVAPEAATRADAQTPAPSVTASGSPPPPAPIAVARQPPSLRSTAPPSPRPAAPPVSPAPAADAAPAAPAQARAEQRTDRADTSGAAAVAPSSTTTASGKGAAATAVVRRDQLPEDVKRNLPPLAVGGSMYSPEPAKRMLILNGQLVREGEKVGPDVVLESIRLRSAILRYKEQRFEITY